MEFRLDGAILAIPDPPTDAPLAACALDEGSKADALDVPDGDHAAGDPFLGHRRFTELGEAAEAEQVLGFTWNLALPRAATSREKGDRDWAESFIVRGRLSGVASIRVPRTTILPLTRLPVAPHTRESRGRTVGEAGCPSAMGVAGKCRRKLRELGPRKLDNQRSRHRRCLLRSRSLLGASALPPRVFHMKHGLARRFRICSEPRRMGERR